MRRLVLLAAACFVTGGAVAQTRHLYRCTGGDGIPTYVSQAIRGQTCTALGAPRKPGPDETTVPVEGKIYSYVKDGLRHFSSRPPVGAGVSDVREVPYRYNAIVPKSSVHPPTTIAQRGFLSFKGYRCTVDCSGHEAGYEWAERRRIEHPDECGGRSQSFIEGCEAYAEEVQLEMIEDGDCSDDDGDELCDDW